MRRAVYTALLGNYERPRSDSPIAGTDTDFICFTDDNELSIGNWNMVRISPMFPGDTVRSARMLKIRGHDALLEYDETLWLDNRVALKVSPDVIFDEYLKSSDVCMPRHSFHASLHDEFAAIMRRRFDDPVRVREQLHFYRAYYPEVFSGPTYWTAIIARRNSEATRRFGSVWSDHVLRFSRRDQLSVAVALVESGVEFTSFELDNLDSALHSWPPDSRMNRRRDRLSWHMSAAAYYGPREYAEDVYFGVRESLRRWAGRGN